MADLAVDAFFVISGFLITASYLHGKSNISFILKRALRIFSNAGLCRCIRIRAAGSWAADHTTSTG